MWIIHFILIKTLVLNYVSENRLVDVECRLVDVECRLVDVECSKIIFYLFTVVQFDTKKILLKYARKYNLYKICKWIKI